MRYLLLTAIVIFSVAPIHGQITAAKAEYAEVDEHVKSISQQMIYHPEVLAESLTSRFADDREKARAIYTWIATNIEYNLVGYSNGLKDTQTIHDVLRSGKALCSGFSMLFAHLCDLAGVEVEIIEGYAKGYGYEEGQKLREPNHAWNAVNLEGSWHLCDVTWASGISEDFVRGKRKIDLDGYFMVDPEQFILTHLPEDPSWQLLDKKKTLREFEKGKGIDGKNIQINAYTPNDYLGMHAYDREVLQFKRSLQFNPDNINFTERLSFAYIYQGIALTEKLWEMSYRHLKDSSGHLKDTFMAYMDSAWQLIDPLPLIRIQKSRRMIEDEINYQKGVFHYELGAELFNKGYNSKRPLREFSKLTWPFFNTARKHFQEVPLQSIYARDAREYLEIIRKYEAKLAKP
jgi:hypothetical protein